jgi:hypothetical protein
MRGDKYFYKSDTNDTPQPFPTGKNDTRELFPTGDFNTVDNSFKPH